MTVSKDPFQADNYIVRLFHAIIFFGMRDDAVQGSFEGIPGRG